MLVSSANKTDRLVADTVGKSLLYNERLMGPKLFIVALRISPLYPA